MVCLNSVMHNRETLTLNKLKPFTKWVGGKRQLEAMKYIGKVFNYKMIESGYLKDYIDQIKKLEYDDIKLKKRTWDGAPRFFF